MDERRKVREGLAWKMEDRWRREGENERQLHSLWRMKKWLELNECITRRCLTDFCYLVE